MLVLTRKVGERIHIGDDIFVEVRRVAGSRVTLAVRAPREVRILRGELLDAADAFGVLDETAAEESAKDTVIIKHHPIEGKDQTIPSQTLDALESSERATTG